MRRLLTTAALLAVALGGVSPVAAQAIAPVAPAADADDAPEESVDDAVARALFEQGLKLYHQNRFADARQLFAESIVRSPTGAYARSARQMLARCNERLGLAPPAGSDDAVPPGEPMDPYGSSASAPEPLDPYAAPDAESAGPVDPYASAPAGELRNPYGDDAAAAAVPEGAMPGHDATPDDKRAVRSSLAVFGGAYGLYTTIGLVAGTGNGFGGGKLLLVLGGAAAGGTAGYWIGEHKHVSKGQVGAVASSTVWGAGVGLMFAHIADSPEPVGCTDCPDDQPGGDYLLASAVASTVGLGAGVWLAYQEPGENDVALVNSLGSYGLLGSLLLGVAMDPAQARGYSMNGLLGTGAGLATGLWLARRVDVAQKRLVYVDVGVASGAVTPWLVYGLAGGGSGSARQWTGAASVGLAALGGWLAWRWTRDIGVAAPAGKDAQNDADELAAAPPALLQRSARGAWSLAPVAPRALVLEPAAADPHTRLGLGLDVVSGRF